MTTGRDPHEPLDPLPLGEAVPVPAASSLIDRRWLALGLAAFVAVAAALSTTGNDDEDLPTPVAPLADEEHTATTTTAVEVSSEASAAVVEPDSTNAAARPSADGAGGFALFAAREARAWIEPNEPLADGQIVSVFAENPFLFVEEAGFALCRIGIDDACTALDSTGFVPGNPNVMSVGLPRRFTDWRGDRHDCLLDGGCEVRLWALDSTLIELNVPVEFDPDGDVRSPLVGDVEVRELGIRTGVQLALDDAIDLTAMACTSQTTAGCETAPLVVTRWDPAGDRIAFLAERLIFTPRGPHDCVLDGPCEVRFTTGDGRVIEPIPLTFDPTVDLELPRLEVRPAQNLADGDLVELRLGETDATHVLYSLCAPDRFFCARFGIAEPDVGLMRRVPRIIEQRTSAFEGDRLIDCAIETCVIRAVADGSVVDQPLSFDPIAPPRPQPELAIAEPDIVHTPGDEITIAVRGLLVADPDPSLRTPVNVRFCEEPTAPSSQCVNAISDGNGVGADGRFQSTVTIPDFERRRSRLEADGERSSFCADECWIVVTTSLASPGANLPLDVRRAESTGG